MSGGRIRTTAADASLVGCFSFFFPPPPFHSFYPAEGKTFPLLLRGPVPPRDDKEGEGRKDRETVQKVAGGKERGKRRGISAVFFFSRTVRRYQPPLRTIVIFLPPSPHSEKNTICHHPLSSPAEDDRERLKESLLPSCFIAAGIPPPKRGHVSKQPHSSQNCASPPNKTPSERGEKRIYFFLRSCSSSLFPFSNTDFSLADCCCCCRGEKLLPSYPKQASWRFWSLPVPDRPGGCCYYHHHPPKKTLSGGKEGEKKEDC